jgi:mRNA interferase YafQ
MRTIERSTSFKRDHKRIKKTPNHSHDIDKLLLENILMLAQDKILPDNKRDHALTGNWYGYRDCHLKPDLVLIYKKIDTDILRLARVGSYSELFG